jgi:hypothetical protein
MNLDRLERVLFMLEESLNTRTKKHIAGGILMSISLLFGGLAITVITLKKEDANEQKYIE